jgi:hypothetical protein
MTPAEFVMRIREEVVDHNIRHYDRLLETPSTTARDPEMCAIILAYEGLDVAQKKAVRALVRQVVIDAISNMFGILDGSSLLRGVRERFSLTYGATRDRLDGDLQEMFLSSET